MKSTRNLSNKTSPKFVLLIGFHKIVFHVKQLYYSYTLFIQLSTNKCLFVCSFIYIFASSDLSLYFVALIAISLFEETKCIFLEISNLYEFFLFFEVLRLISCLNLLFCLWRLNIVMELRNYNKIKTGIMR